MLRIGVLVSGGGTNLQAIIDAIEDDVIRNAEIVTVVSNRKAAYALKRAEKHNISTAYISTVGYEKQAEYDFALVEHFKNENVDLIVMAGFLVVLGGAFIRAFENKIINIHPSLIPSFCGDGYYGIKVHEAVLEKGVKVTGATVHFVDEGTDTGPIIDQKVVRVHMDDTAEILQRRVMEEAEWYLLPKAIDAIANDAIEIINNKVWFKSQG